MLWKSNYIGSWKKSIPNTSPGSEYSRTVASVANTTRQDGGLAGAYGRGHAENFVFMGSLVTKLSSRRTPRISLSKPFWYNVFLHSIPSHTAECGGRPWLPASTTTIA